MSEKKAAPQITPELSANDHEVVRQQHREERTEDYVEAIFRLQKGEEDIRVVDLQDVFGVSHVTVIRTLDRLEKEGFIERGKRGIALLDKGQRLAIACYQRHQTVESFLLALGVPEEAARRDAEGIEHHLGEESLKAMNRYLEKRENSP